MINEGPVQTFASSKQVNVAARLYTCIREVAGSIVSKVTGLCLEIGHDSLRENPYLLDAVD
jgi:hypothetical protein